MAEEHPDRTQGALEVLGPVRLWHGDNIKYDCDNDLEACEDPGGSEPEPEKGNQTKLDEKRPPKRSPFDGSSGCPQPLLKSPFGPPVSPRAGPNHVIAYGPVRGCSISTDLRVVAHPPNIAIFSRPLSPSNVL